MCSSSLTWRLAPTVHAASVDGDLVLLDVGRDAYVCLPSEKGAVQLAPDRCGVIADDELIQDLQAALLIEPGAHSTSRAVASWVAPTRTALLDQYPGPRWGDLPGMLVSLADLGLRYRRRAFSDIVRDGAGDRTCPPRLRPGLLAAVQDFHRWVPFAPVSGKCLLRSFMLLRHLRRNGLDAQWVFGVRTWPFDAHCWLQCEDVALDEQPDRIRSYTPIMVV